MSQRGTEWKQDFFSQVPPIRMTDPLAAVLGATEDGGVIEYTFEDCVKLAGHACVSVASAFMITRLALERLYPDSIPERGGLEVRLAGGRTEGAKGPIGQVIGFITGAAVETGFHGLGGRFHRDNLFVYDEGMDIAPGAIGASFRRLDNGKKVTVTAEPALIPLSDREREGAQYMPKAIQGSATAQERESFFHFWQGRNRKVLLENPKGVFTVSEG